MSLEMLPAKTSCQSQAAAGEMGMEEKELFQEMAKLDRELLAMIEADPELGEVYAEEMGFDGIMLNEHHGTPFCMGMPSAPGKVPK